MTWRGHEADVKSKKSSKGIPIFTFYKYSAFFWIKPKHGTFIDVHPCLLHLLMHVWGHFLIGSKNAPIPRTGVKKFSKIKKIYIV